MKLLTVKIEEESVAEFIPGTQILKKVQAGTCIFRGESGDMSFKLSGEDIEAVQQVLMHLCLRLAEEV